MAARRILLGLSFFDQTDAVTETLKTFLKPAGDSHYEFILGLENEKRRSEVAPVLSALKEQGWSVCYLWDDDVNRSAMRLLDGTSAMPFFANFSYGAAVNRMLLLAIASGCEYVIRMDPGTGSPPNMAQLVDRHTSAISQGKKVVSGQYTKRVAIRDDFVDEARRADYYSFVKAFTGIACGPGCQITGGAAMTLSPAGPPAIVFDKVRVWASDDGFFEMFLGADQTDVQNEIKIERSEPGVGLELSAYIARVAAMVLLRHAHEGRARDLGLRNARQFLEDVRAFVSTDYSYDPGNADGIVTPQVDAVYGGYENYLKLVQSWPSIAGRVIDGIERNELIAWG